MASPLVPDVSNTTHESIYDRANYGDPEEEQYMDDDNDYELREYGGKRFRKFKNKARERFIREKLKLERLEEERRREQGMKSRRSYYRSRAEMSQKNGDLTSPHLYSILSENDDRPLDGLGRNLRLGRRNENIEKRRIQRGFNVNDDEEEDDEYMADQSIRKEFSLSEGKYVSFKGVKNGDEPLKTISTKGDNMLSVKKSHNRLFIKYSKSVSANGMDARSASRVAPERLKAGVVDVILSKGKNVITIDENKFLSQQKLHFGRNKADVNELQSNAIDFFKRSLGIDFSRVRNPSVKKDKSSLIISDGNISLSPYIFGGSNSVTPTVMSAKGFPSLKKGDSVIDMGYVLSIHNPSGTTVHGIFGGKKGKVLSKGQAFYFSELLIKPTKAIRKPEWIRMVSDKPSMKTEKNTSISEMSVRRISLFQKGGAEKLNSYSGSVKRTMKVEPGRNKNGDLEKKVNVVYQIDFD